MGLAATHSAAAQSTAALRGTVTDSLSGQPLVGVSVALVGQPGGTATGAAAAVGRMGPLARRVVVSSLPSSWPWVVVASNNKPLAAGSVSRRISLVFNKIYSL